MYSIHYPGHVFAGDGSYDALKQILKQERAGNVAIFSDNGLMKTGLVDPIQRICQENQVSYQMVTEIPPEPAAQDVQRLFDNLRDSEIDLMIAIGGGSVMDTAKLASVCYRADYTVFDLLETPEIARKHVKTIMIPTTAGTGSEATPNAIVAVPEKQLKVGIVNHQMICDWAILHEENTAGLPRHIAAAGGVDALAHAIECYTSNKATPLSDTYAMQAMRLIFPNIEKACNGGDNRDARRKMLLGSFYAGMAITAAGTTAVHALSYPLGGSYHIAHGVSNAMLLYPVMRFNCDSIEGRLADVCDELHMADVGLSDREKADTVIEHIGEIVEALDIPTSLRTYIENPEEELDRLVDSAFQVKRLLNNNVKVLTKEDIRSIYLQII